MSQICRSVFDPSPKDFNVNETRARDGYINRTITNRKTGKKTKISYGNAAGLRWGMAYAMRDVQSATGSK